LGNVSLFKFCKILRLIDLKGINKDKFSKINTYLKPKLLLDFIYTRIDHQANIELRE